MSMQHLSGLFEKNKKTTYRVVPFPMQISCDARGDAIPKNNGLLYKANEFPFFFCSSCCNDHVNASFDCV